MARARGQATVLFYPSAEIRDRWVAHCLDYDLVGTGDDMIEAFEELEDVIQVQFKGCADLRKRGKKAAMPGPAPKQYWDALKIAQKLPPIGVLWRQKRVAKRKAPQRGTPSKYEVAWLKDRASLAAAAT